MSKSPLPKRRCPKTLEENLSVLGKERDEELTKLLSEMEAGCEFKEGDVIMEHGGVYANSIVRHLIPIVDKLNCKIYGVENSESMIEHAKTNYPHPGVEYIYGELTDIDFPLKDVKFNKIFSMFYLQFLTVDYMKELRAMYDLLAPGGQVILGVAHNQLLAIDVYKYIREHEDFFEHGLDHVPDMNWVYELSRNTENWKKEVEKGTGFNVSQLTREEKGYKFEKLGVLLDLLMAINTFAHDLPPAQKNTLREAYKKVILETPTTTFSPDGNTKEHHEYKLEYIIFNVRLVKE